MRQRWLILVAAFLVAAALACKKDETTSSDTASTSTTASDTSGTTSTTDTSGTSATSATTSSAAATLDKKDSEFVTKTAQGGIAEVQISQMAQSKSTNADVKKFADRMVNDHTKANDELKSLATSKGVTLPVDIDDAHRKAADELAKKNGKEYDAAYMKAMVEDHEKVVKAFEAESKDAKDADLKSWVTKTLPTIQDHLKMAKETQKKVK